jgi:uncharacterized protein YndB with AHSA1/START domain
MAIDLHHQIYITAPAEMVYRAITTEEGIRNWWTTDVTMDSKVGGKAVFGFENHSVFFQMRIEELKPDSVVRWVCDGGNSAEWAGTTQEFLLEPQADGDVLLKFSHNGWKPGSTYCYLCNTTWGHLMVMLKNYAEEGVNQPYFT